MSPLLPIPMLIYDLYVVKHINDVQFAITFWNCKMGELPPKSIPYSYNRL
jgi:hypothetical protein